MTTLHDADASRLPGVLVVDPDTRARAELTRGLEAQGWHVWAAADGAAAVETYRRFRGRIDAALIDLQLPGLQGGLVLAELGRIDPDLIRCATAADVSPYVASAFRRMSDTPLFTKPLAVRALAYTLQEMIMPAGRR